jgi:hypothetical protein
MTTPFSRTKALVQTKELLQQLADTAAPGVPDDVRLRAQALLPSFPTLADIEALRKAAPELMGPVPPFSRLSLTVLTPAPSGATFLGRGRATAAAGGRCTSTGPRAPSAKSVSCPWLLVCRE